MRPKKGKSTAVAYQAVTFTLPLRGTVAWPSHYSTVPSVFQPPILIISSAAVPARDLLRQPRDILGRGASWMNDQIVAQRVEELTTRPSHGGQSVLLYMIPFPVCRFVPPPGTGGPQSSPTRCPIPRALEDKPPTCAFRAPK